MRLAGIAPALASLVATAACADDEPAPPSNLVFTAYDGYLSTSSDHVVLSIDVAQNRVTVMHDGGAAYTAQITTEGNAQIDLGERQVEETWDPAEPCPTCRIPPESFHFNSDQGPIIVAYDFVEPGTNADHLRAVVQDLVLQLTECRGGPFIAQCFEQP